MNFALPDLAPGSTADRDSAGLNAAARDLALAFGSVAAQLHEHLGGCAGEAALIGQMAAAVSRVVSEGHTCLPIDRLAACLGITLGEGEQALEILLRSPIALDGSRARVPGANGLLVLDEKRLYLQRYWQYEVRLAQRLRHFDQPAPVASGLPLHHTLAQFFEASHEPPNWQQVAAATALTRRLTVITGGPGTGKTRTVARMLAALSRLTPGMRIALCAPTGKAALRLEQSIASQLQQLQLDALLPDLAALRAQTVHRLLGPRFGSVQFLHDRQRPLPYDLIVVDEASMLDLAMAAKLLDALNDDARLVLLGDAHQLASVETGAVFAELSALSARDASCAEELALLCDVAPREIVAPHLVHAPPLGNAVVALTTSFRYDSEGGIGQMAQAVRLGQGEIAALGLDRPERGVSLIDAPVDARALANTLIEAFAEFMETVQAGAEPLAVLQTLERYRVLCALRQGPLGVDAINRALQSLIAQELGQTDHEAWFAGRVVMVTQNDSLLKLYNGDVGVALQSDHGLLVHFEHGGATRALAPARLPNCETAYALTVHKAQGSEFDRIDVILPVEDSPLNSRELLYTALTRARRQVRLWGSLATVKAAIAQPTERFSALGRRLRDKT